VTFYQTSTKLPNVHPIRFDSVRKWFDSLNLFACHNSEIGARIVSVVDWSKSAVYGIKVAHDNVPYTLATVKKNESMVTIASRTETYIVRAGIYSSTVKHAISRVDRGKLTALLDALTGNGKVKQ
jgi:hypothetical protein